MTGDAAIGSSGTRPHAGQHEDRGAADGAGTVAPRPTLADVAALAGCSLPTASKALAGRSEVSSRTRARVVDAAATLGYERRARRAVANDGPPVVSAAFDSFDSMYTTEVFGGALAAATKRGMELKASLLPPREDGAGRRAWLERQMAGGSIGAFLVTSDLDRSFVAAARSRRLPLVAVDPKSHVDDSITTIGATNWAGARMATQHLIDLGHRRIAFAVVERGSDYSLERLAGYRSTLESAGLEFDPALVFNGTTHYKSGFEVGSTIAGLAHPPSAVVCLCDSVAFGVIEGARVQGTHTPDDLSVVGFDDVAAAQWCSPALTTVRQPLRRMGSLAVRTLLRLARGADPDSPHIQLATSLVVRSSTAAPPTPRDRPGRLSGPPEHLR